MLRGRLRLPETTPALLTIGIYLELPPIQFMNWRTCESPRLKNECLHKLLRIAESMKVSKASATVSLYKAFHFLELTVYGKHVSTFCRSYF
jgi:hypothetical protein